VNCKNVPGFIVGFVGVTVIVLSVAAVTSRVVDPLTPLNAAPIVVDPIALVVAKPPLAMVATVAVDELHVAVVVRSFIDPSL
jgi:hypothetical protein